MKKVIFACVHSAGRSQMAAAIFNKHANNNLYLAFAAGTEPALKIHPEVQTVMLEVGIDLTNAKPTLLTQQLAQDAVLLITMGCGEKCPYVPGLKIIDWQLSDPKGKGLDQVRIIRDEIEKLVMSLIDTQSYNSL
jgi:arsenate reductase (thioredoxin)